MMELYVNRDTFTSLSTIGELLIEDQHECWTLEPPWREDGVKPRAIGEGRYRLVRRYSASHGRDVPGVEGVDGFSDVEMHPGNFPRDTKACTLVGRTKGPLPDFIGVSKPAFEALWSKLVPVWERGEEVWITYRNSPDAQFEAQLRSYLTTSSDGIEPSVPLFYHGNGAINRAKTLTLACYANFQYR